MEYNYEEMKKSFLYTDEGQKLFLEVRDKAERLVKEAGCFAFGFLHSKVNGVGNSHQFMACIDRLLELEELTLVEQKKAENKHDRWNIFISYKFNNY